VSAAEAALQKAGADHEAAQAVLGAHRSRADHAAGEVAARRETVARLPWTEVEEELRQRRADLERLPVPAAPATADDVQRARDDLERRRAELEAIERDLQAAHGALTQVGGLVVAEKEEELRQAVAAARDRQRQVEVDAGAWRLLAEVLRQAERTGARHLGRVLGDEVGRRFADLTGQRYGTLELDPGLQTLGVQAGGGRRGVGALSAGTREQLATLLRLAIAESLQSAIVLDDHLVQTDPERLGWFLGSLEQASSKVQVIVVTCRQRDYRRATAEGSATSVQWVDLDAQIRRFPPRPADGPAALLAAPPPSPPVSLPPPAPVLFLVPAPEPAPPPSAASAPVSAPAAAAAPAPAAAPPALPEEGRPFSELLGHALHEMGASSEDFARSVMAGHRVVQLWLKGGSLPAVQLRPTVIEFLLRGRGNAAQGSARAAAAARLAGLGS
jgi:hypothetical protein